MNKLCFFLYSIFIYSINCKDGDIYEGEELVRFLGKLNSIRTDKKLLWDDGSPAHNANGVSQTCKQWDALYRDYYSYFKLELKGAHHDEEEVANKLIEKYEKLIKSKQLEKISCSATPCEKEGNFMYVVCAFPKISDMSGSDENTNTDKKTGGDETDDKKSENNDSAEEPGEETSEEKDVNTDKEPEEETSEEKDVDTDKEPEEETSEEKEADTDKEPEEETSEEKEADSDEESDEGENEVNVVDTDKE